MSEIPPVAVLEEILIAALNKGDAEGVEHTLKLIAVQDPNRASTLVDAIQLGIGLGSTT